MERINHISSPQVQKVVHSPVALEEEKAFGKPLEQYIAEHRNEYKCVFCKHKSILQAGDTNIVLCYHCFKIIQMNIDGLKRFMDCQ